MGWLFRDDKLRHQTPAEYFTQHLTHESETASATVIATATVRRTVYAAIRNHNKQTGAAYIFCAVILFKNSDKDGFGYKDLDESVGPCEVDCPDRIMRLLTPVADIPNPCYAADWRERVTAAKASRLALRQGATKLSKGDLIKLPYEVKVAGISTDSFTLIEFRKRTPIFTPLGHPFMRCRLRQATLAQATITR